MVGAAIHNATRRDVTADHAVTLKSAGYLAITNERVLVFKSSARSRPTELLAEVRRSDAILDIEPFRTFGIQRARLRLSDSLQIIVEAESAGHGRVADELVEVRTAVPQGTHHVSRR